MKVLFFLSILKKMKINIKILEGKTIILNNIYQNYAIEEIKNIIEKKDNIPKDKQILTFNDKELENDKILSELGVNKDSTLYLKIILDIKISENKKI